MAYAQNQPKFEYLQQLRWPEVFRCPICNVTRGWQMAEGLMRCSKCKQKTSVLSGTIFHGTRKPLRLWFQATWYVTSQKFGGNALGLKRVLGLGSYQTAWNWLHKMRKAMVLPGRDKLGGIVEVDALADGWGGSMIATELSDVMFGTPSPTLADFNMGVLKEDHVNIIVHGHEPAMFEGMLAAVNDKFFIDEAKAKGAEGINLVGMCCSGAEMMSRHGVSHAGSFGSTEAVIVTGAVDAIHDQCQ